MNNENTLLFNFMDWTLIIEYNATDYLVNDDKLIKFSIKIIDQAQKEPTVKIIKNVTFSKLVQVLTSYYKQSPYKITRAMDFLEVLDAIIKIVATD